jgi:hypothetical protein
MASSLPKALAEFPRGNYGPGDHPDPDTGHAASGKGDSVSTSANPRPGHAESGTSSHAHGSAAGGNIPGSAETGHSENSEHEGGSAEVDRQAADVHGVRADPERRFCGLRLIPDPFHDQHGFNPADPLAGLYSERLRSSIERQAFQASSAETQDALIAQRAGINYVAPGKTVSPLMAQLLEKVASGDVVVPSAA